MEKVLPVAGKLGGVCPTKSAKKHKTGFKNGVANPLYNSRMLRPKKSENRLYKQ